MKKIKIVLLAISGLLIASCESSTIQDITAVVENPNYAVNISYVMSKNCTSCHSAAAAAGKRKQPYLETYSQVVDATEGSLICRIEGSCNSIMPPGKKMPSATIEMIKKWQNDQYPEN